MSSTPIVITTSVDLAGIEGYKTAIKGVAASNAEAAASFNTVTGAAAQQAARFMQSGMSAKEAEGALIGLGYSAKEAAATMEELTGAQAKASIVADAQAAAEARVSGEVKELQKQLRAAAAAQVSMDRAQASATVRAASQVAGLGSLGFSLARVATQSSMLSGALAVAFPVVALAAFVELLMRLPDMINEATDALAGWDAEAKKDYADAITENARMIELNLKLKTEQQEQNLVGIEGEKRKRLAIQDASDSIARQSEALVGLARGINATTAEITELKRKEIEAYQIPDLVNMVLTHARLKAQLEDENKSLENQTKLREQLADQLRQLEAQRSKIAPTAGVQEAADARLNAEARIAAEKTYADAVESYDQQIYRSRYQLGQISLAQETALMQESENRQFAAAEEGYKKLRALKLQEGAVIGKNVIPEIERMDAEEEQLRIAHNAKVVSLESSAQLQIRKQYEETADAKIEAEGKIAESQLRVAETAQKLAMDHADSPAELEAAAIPYIKTVTDQYQQQIAAKRELAQVTEQALSAEQRPTANIGTDAFTKQLESIRAVQPEIYKQLLEMNAEVITLQNDQASAVIEIKTEENEKLKAMRAKTLDDTIADLNRQEEGIKVHYQGELTALETLQSRKSISELRFADEAKSIAERELADKLAMLEKEKTAVEAAARQDIISAREAARQLQEIDQKELQEKQQTKNRELQITRQEATQEQQEMKRVLSEISASLNSNLNEWMNHHKKFGQAVAQTWDQIVIKATDSIMKMAESFALGLLTQGVAQEKAVLMSAKTAAAKAWAAAANPIAGAVEAAATFAAVVGSYMPSFDRGGIMPATGPAMLHAREMVLPEHISSFVQDAAAGKIGESGGPGGMGGPGGRGGDAAPSSAVHNHNHFELHVHGGKTSKDDVIDWVKQGIHSGSLP